MQQQVLAKWMMLLAAVLFAVGIIVYFFGDKLGWIGNLPGDISIEKENFKLYFPITTMVIFSLILNVLYRIFTKV